MNRIIKLNRVLNFRNLNKIAHINNNFIVQPSLNRNFNFNQCYRFASTIGTGTTVDPAETEAFEQMEEGTRLLNEGDVDGAKKHYERSLDIRTTAMGLFNLGVTQFYEKDISSAIASWEQSIKLYPSNADAHTNIASAHILSSPSNPEKALHHLKRAQHLSPEDGEITFNLAVVSEATGNLNDAYDNYQKAKSLGVERAEENIRNVSVTNNVIVQRLIYEWKGRSKVAIRKSESQRKQQVTLNTFKRSWEDAVDDPDADAYPWSPSPPKAKSELETPPSPPKMDGRARRRAAILKALASNSNAGSSNSNNDRNSSSYTNSRDEKQVKKIKPVEPKLVPVVKDHEDKDLKPITKPKPDVNHDLTKNELSKGPQIQRRLCLSSEQQKVLQLVADENKNVFFTGSAGTGKSVLLREIISALRAKWKRTPESVAVTASTGIAACNIGGTTLHSFTGCGLCAESVQALAQKVRRNAKALKRWTKVKVLIIDEISMVDGDLFDKLEQLARNIRKRTEPFGNIQIIVCGDFFQLPPVNKGSQPNFCFDAESWSRVIDHTINLRQVFRQRDETFVKMLNEMRFGQMSEDSIKRFKSLSRPLRFDDGIEPTELFPLRQQVDQSNDNRMQQLDGETKVFMALDSGDLPKDQRDKVLSNFMAPKVLHLKVNSQVMLIKNIDETLVNGSQGRVVAFVDVVSYTKGTSMHNDEDLRSLKRKGSSSVVDEFSISNRPTKRDSGIPYPLVQFLLPNGRLREILCVPDVWKTEGINGKIEAARNQVPLVLAWSMSIHKSQGQTLERVKVDLTKVFERGQSYVSLSRATTLDALQVIGFDPRKVTAHPRVIEWHKTLETV